MSSTATRKASKLYPFLDDTNDKVCSVRITYTIMGAVHRQSGHFTPRLYSIKHHFGLTVRQPVV